MREYAARIAVIMLLALGMGVFAPYHASAESEFLKLPRFPSISPDGSEIVFSAGGNLWLAPVQGGEAKRLTSHNLDDLHSSWSPDGESIVFTSMRDGYMNLWRIQRDGTRSTQLTYSDRFINNPDWTRDREGREVITFSSLLEADVYRDQRPYRVSPQGGEHERLHDAFGSDPRFSPDGKRVAFTRGGHYHDWNRRHYRGPDAMNVWVHDLINDRFEALTEWEGDDGNARWIDDNTLVFMSDRQLDTVNLYSIRLDDDTREPQRLTNFEGRDVHHFDVSRDGGTAVLQVWDRLYSLDLGDPEAEPTAIALRMGDDGWDGHALRWINRDVTEAALSPDGKMMAFIAYGRVYVRHMDAYSPTRAVTPDSHARHQDIAWSPDGLYLYFSSDEDGTSSIYKAQVVLTRKEIQLSSESQAAEALKIAEQAQASDLAFVPLHVSPDPKYMYASLDSGMAEDPFTPVGPNDPLDPVDPEPGLELPEDETSESKDVCTADQSALTPGQQKPARWHDAVQFRVLPVVAEQTNDRNVSPSPNGNSIAFRRGRGDLVVMDLLTGDKRTLVRGWDSNLEWRWSPDGRHIAYAQNDLNFSTNIFIVPADGSKEPVNITRHPRNDFSPRWSADGRKLTFVSNRTGDSYDLYRVYLDPDMENWTRAELNNYYREAQQAAEKRRPLPVRKPGTMLSISQPEWQVDRGLELENAWRRVERVTFSPANQIGNEMTPSGDRYVFNNGSEGLVVVNWDGRDRKRLGPRGNVQHLNIVGDRVVYIVDGRVSIATLNGRTNTNVDISDRIRIDLRRQSLQKFREAARVIEEAFYRPDLKGLDWKALVADYEELVVRARTAGEFSDITNRLLGELAASHMGLHNPGPGSALREPSGRLGIDSEQVALENGRKGYRITEIIPGSPADRGPVRMQQGDVVTSIDMRGFDESDTLLERLRGKVDQEVIVGFERPVGNRRLAYQTILTPISYSEFAHLRYEAFQEESRRRVAEMSGGRIGYIHIQAMNEASLERFQAYLYAAAEGKDGLIIDVRNNGGGHTSDRILTSIMASEHAYTIPAGAEPYRYGRYPQDRLDAPRYTLPINMLANEKSFSNSEILAHAFTTLGRGTLVGRQTYGGVISTGSHSLIDGASVRTPFRGWYLPDGTDMEHNGAMPDLVVEHTPADEIAGRDRQLEAAVREMLQKLPLHAAVTVP
ncbi:S41 family peptidase [Desulfonatronum thiosulfatophilum]|nr:S41 family peptidase [Desulfonatronum thiosulfatophilum]